MFGVGMVDMLRSSTREEKFREKIGWTVNDQGEGSYSSVDVEILHKDYAGKYNLWTAFLNPLLMQVGEVILMSHDCY
jgi:hypothetical protein